MSELTIPEFLLARVAEDEEDARDAYYEGQQWAPEEEAVIAVDKDWDPIMFLDRKCDARHAANWSPARVLAECEAKRRIIFRHNGPHECPSGGTDLSAPCSTLHHLTLPYADHPDYDPDWAI